MAQSSSGVVEHSVHIPAHEADQQDEIASPERRLNCFVRSVALVERVGNALGTLAFTWTTVVLLGGYLTNLRTCDDFWFATAIFFLEAARMFSRNNRMDYQLFFGTRGAFRLVGWNELILIVYYIGTVCIVVTKINGINLISGIFLFLPVLWILVFIAQFVYLGAKRLLARYNPVGRVISLWSPMVAILLLVPSISGPYYHFVPPTSDDGDEISMTGHFHEISMTGHFHEIRIPNHLHQISIINNQPSSHPPSIVNLITNQCPQPTTSCHPKDVVGNNPVSQHTRWVSYGVLAVVVLLVTISRMRFPSIIKLVDSVLGRKQEFGRRIVLTLCMIGAIGIASSAYFLDADMTTVVTTILAVASTLVLVSFGNLQIPAATVRVVLPLIRLIPNNYNYPCPTKNCNHACQEKEIQEPSRHNLAPSLDIFYGMVLGQGVLYAVACLLEIFSFFPRRSLLRLGGFSGQWGVDSVNLYYAYALEKCLERNVLAPKISLCSFAIDSLNSDSTKRQLHGIRTSYILLRKDPTRTRLLDKFSASTETMTRLMRMMDWTGQGRETIRLFAVKVIDELAKDLLVVTVPEIVQNVSLLLDCGDQQKRGNPLLDVDDEQEQQNDLSVSIIGDPIDRGDAVPGTRNLLETEGQSTEQVRNNEHDSWISRRWRQVSAFWSVPQEEPLTEQDLLPVLGMSIIDNLATCDQSNCKEISKASGLIRKIARFCSSDTKYTGAQETVLVHSSLKLFHRLTSIDGEIGMTLRRKISKHPFLLRNLSEILGDTTSYHEPRKLAAGILRNLAVDASVRQTIGGVQRIITRLMDAFLTPDGPSDTDGDRLLRKVAGQASAMLAIGNANNCIAIAMLREETLIKELATMINKGRYRCVAASLLRSLCMYTQPEFKETTELKELSQKVLERIKYAKGVELEIFVGLSSHIYKAIPEEFPETFLKRLVDALNANMEPNGDCPGIRRVILEQTINLIEYDPRNVNCFRDYRMMEAVSIVEETMSDAENYSLFLGDVGLMEAGEPLSSLVAKAKQLLALR